MALLRTEENYLPMAFNSLYNPSCTAEQSDVPLNCTDLITGLNESSLMSALQADP